MADQAFTVVAEVFRDGEPAYTVAASDRAVDAPPAGCSSCGERFPLYGDRRLCYLCLQGAGGNQGIPDLTSHFGQDGEG